VQPDICPIKFISSLLGMTFISFNLSRECASKLRKQTN